MFDGEFESLKAIQATNTIRVPKPLLVVDNPKGGAALVMEYLEFRSIGRKANLLGDQIARLHMHNIEQKEKDKSSEQYVGAPENTDPPRYVSKFGFHSVTCCGYIPQSNDWCDDWPYGDREAVSLWSTLSAKLPDFFKGMNIEPSLLHGDLWSGNIGETSNEPVIFDPASFYGHHEYELAIAGMFGGFGRSFWEAYHNVIPKTEGWDRRHKLYVLFHNLNHWTSYIKFGHAFTKRTIMYKYEIYQSNL
ncbi:Fructosamine-3-kinase [Armadillidium nasatum]|uniref:protein-ribulosamine 3-kinase n=1 Tax=Armadillidium nasatum TaxID=96803 RepID=A0A5N5TBU0_9CRUS|nr:Fructosamine-3-kinase [Armadillidium nasatum]